MMNQKQLDEIRADREGYEILLETIEECENCSGNGQIYHRRSCAEEDPSGWYPCNTCGGSGKSIKHVRLLDYIAAVESDVGRLRKQNNLIGEALASKDVTIDAIEAANKQLAKRVSILRSALDTTPCHCKDCKWAKGEPHQGGIVCVNADSDWCADYPPEDGSRRYCERIMKGE